MLIYQTDPYTIYGYTYKLLVIRKNIGFYSINWRIYINEIQKWNLIMTPLHGRLMWAKNILKTSHFYLKLSLLWNVFKVSLKITNSTFMAARTLFY